MAGRGSAAAQQALTDEDVTAVRDELSAGRAVTVWFTKAAVGVPEGGSAKVVAVGEVAEGDFIQVRPAGSRDAVFCSAGELTRSRPARRSATPARKATDATTPPPTASPATASPATASPATAAPATAARTRRTEEAPAPDPTSEKPVPQEPGSATPAPAKPAKAAARARRRPERAGPLTISLTSSAEGDWAVEVLVGAKRIVPSTPVQAADVAVASRSLPPAVTEVVTSALAEARRRQEERVARLREELDAAQRTLEQLGVD